MRGEARWWGFHWTHFTTTRRSLSLENKHPFIFSPWWGGDTSQRPPCPSGLAGTPRVPRRGQDRGTSPVPWLCGGCCRPCPAGANRGQRGRLRDPGTWRGETARPSQPLSSLPHPQLRGPGPPQRAASSRGAEGNSDGPPKPPLHPLLKVVRRITPRRRPGRGGTPGGGTPGRGTRGCVSGRPEPPPGPIPRAAGSAAAARGKEPPKKAAKLSRPRPRTPRGTGTASAAAAPDRAGGRGAPPAPPATAAH